MNVTKALNNDFFPQIYDNSTALRISNQLLKTTTSHATL